MMHYNRFRGECGVPDDGYKRLGCAIAQQAVEDYKTASMIEMPYSRNLAQKPLKAFFRSEWCHDLCGVQPGVWEDFFERIKKEEPEPPAMEEPQKGYAEDLCEKMKKHGIKQEWLAKSLDISSASISGYVNGDVLPREKNRLLIKGFFDSLEK